MSTLTALLLVAALACLAFAAWRTLRVERRQRPQAMDERQAEDDLGYHDRRTIDVAPRRVPPRPPSR
jgi:hypothetical protein